MTNVRFVLLGTALACLMAARPAQTQAQANILQHADFRHELLVRLVGRVRAARQRQRDEHHHRDHAVLLFSSSSSLPSRTLQHHEHSEHLEHLEHP